jgi:acetyltransferase
VGRLSKARGLNEAEFALIISDRWQRQGLGTELLKRLVQIGRNEKLQRISANILSENHGMQLVSKRVGFQLMREGQGQDFRAVIVL